MRLATYSTRAVVLRMRLIGEKDRVITLFSPDEGKFDAVAKGARNPKSKLASVSQPFTLARFLLARGRSLDIASQAEVDNAHTHIAGDLLRTAWASYVCELCGILPERQPDARVFELLCTALTALNLSPREDIEATGFWFQAHFLAQLGYPPVLGRCVVGGEKIVVPPDDFAARVPFSAQMGGTLCARCAPRDPHRINPLAQALRALRVLERAAHPPPDEQLQLTTAARRDLRDVLRLSLLAHLDARPKSQKFLDDVGAESLGGA